MNWGLAEAEHRLTELIDAATKEPQLIYSQDELIAAIVEPQLFQEFLHWRSQHQSIADAFVELRKLCEEENYTLDIPPRQDRVSSFIDDDSSL